MTLNFDISDEIIRKSIDDLEKLDLIPAIDKAHLLLVAAGIKPSMHTGIFSKQMKDGEEVHQPDIDSINTLSKIIASLSLKYKIESRKYTDTENGIPLHTTLTIFYIAQRDNVVDRLLKARTDEDFELEGVLLGFPKSAVDAYIRGDVIAVVDHPSHSEDVTEDEMKFLNHMISPSNWKDEVKYLPDYADVTCQISPVIYAQVLAA